MVRLMQFSKKISFQIPKGSYIPDTFKYLFMVRKSFHVCILGYPFGYVPFGVWNAFFLEVLFWCKIRTWQRDMRLSFTCSVCWEVYFSNFNYDILGNFNMHNRSFWTRAIDSCKYTHVHLQLHHVPTSTVYMDVSENSGFSPPNHPFQ